MIVIVVPVKGNGFVMVKHPNRGWEFPGGRVEEGESEIDAALRECEEEAGIKLKNLKVIKRDRDMVVFRGDVVDIKGGEMTWKFFSEIPSNLSFSREEAAELLKLAGFKI
jgi:8-oxo-dGTP diphosphatase